jgi:hypothetical protein
MRNDFKLFSMVMKGSGSRLEKQRQKASSSLRMFRLAGKEYIIYTFFIFYTIKDLNAGFVGVDEPSI